MYPSDNVEAVYRLMVCDSGCTTSESQSEPRVGLGRSNTDLWFGTLWIKHEHEHLEKHRKECQKRGLL